MLLFSPSAQALEACGITTSCIPAPPNGGPRYDMPSSQFDPAKAATERYMEKLAKAKAQDAAAAAVKTEKQ